MTNGRLPEKCQRLSNLYTNKTQYKIQNNYEQNRKKIQKYEKKSKWLDKTMAQSTDVCACCTPHHQWHNAWHGKINRRQGNINTNQKCKKNKFNEDGKEIDSGMRVYNKSELPRTDPRDAQHRAYSVVQCTQTSVATVACRTKLITLAKVNVPSQNVFFWIAFRTKFRNEVTLFSETSEFCNTCDGKRAVAKFFWVDYGAKFKEKMPLFVEIFTA